MNAKLFPAVVPSRNIVLPTVTLALCGFSSAATINWKNNTVGNWSDTANWNPAAIPNAAGDVARYTHTGNAGAAGTATLDQNATVGIIDHQAGVGGSTGVFTVAKSGSFTLTMDNSGGITNLFGNTNAAIVGNGNGNTFNITQVHPDIVIANTDLDIGSLSGGVLIGTGANTNAITSSGPRNLNLRWDAGNAARPNTINASIGGSGTGTITLHHFGAGTGTALTTVAGTLGAQVSGVIQNTRQATMLLSGTNSYTGQTRIDNGALRAKDGTGLPNASHLSLNGGVLEGQGVTSFTRALGTSGNTFQMTANGGGFSANGGQMTVNIGAGAALTWGSTVGSELVGTLKLGSPLSNNKTLVQNAIDLNGADRNIEVTGDNGELSGILSNSTGTAGLVKSGSGILVLSGANTYNGNTTVASGILRFASSTPLTGLATNSVNVSTGAVAAAAYAIDQDFLTKVSTASTGAVALHVASANNLDLTGFTNTSLGATAAVAYSGTITPNARLYRVGGGSANLTLQTVLADNGGATSLAKAGNDTVVLNQANTYSGTTTVNRGTLSLDFSNAASPLTDIVSTGSSLALGGGTLALTGKASTTNSQAVTGLAVNAGASALTLTANATANPLLLNLGAVTRATGGTVNFTQPVGTLDASNGLVTSTANDSGGILGGWATIGATDWASNNGTNLVALASYATDTWSAGNNTNVTANTAVPADSTTHSLRFHTAGVRTHTLAGTNTITSGGILVTNTVGNNLSTLTGGIVKGASGKDLVVIQNNTTNATGLIIGSEIADNTSATGLTKSGAGNLTLTGPNTYTGTTLINAGTLTIGNNSSSGSLDPTGGIVNHSSLVFNRSNSLSQGFDFGGISGSGSITKNAAGSLELSSANTHSGGTTLNAGSLLIAAGTTGTVGAITAGPLGTGGLGLTGGTLMASDNLTPRSILNPVSIGGNVTLGDSGNSAKLTFSAPVSLGSGVRTLTVQSEVQIDGPVSSGFLVKAGSGKLTLTADNAFSQGLAVNSGTLALGASASIGWNHLVNLAAGGTLDTSARSSFPMPASQTFTFGIDPASGTSGIIVAAGLDISNAVVKFSTSGTLDDPAYVLATYTSKTGAAFASVTPPAGYELDYGYQGNKIALVQAGYSTWQNANAPGQSAEQDHDYDGILNGVEYFMGESGSGFTANPTLDAANTITWPMGATYTGAYDTDYVIQTSGDLTTWTPVPSGDVTIVSGTSVSFTLTGPGKRFVRLVVTP